MAVSKEQEHIIRRYELTHRRPGPVDFRPWNKRGRKHPKTPENLAAEQEYLARPIGWRGRDLRTVVGAVRKLTRARKRDRVQLRHLIWHLRREQVSSWWGKVIMTCCDVGLLRMDDEEHVYEMPLHPDER